MRPTSFGSMEILRKDGNMPQVEYLEFNQAGRSHKHPNYEYFFILQGEGKVYVGEEIHEVGPGDTVCIPPPTIPK